MIGRALDAGVPPHGSPVMRQLLPHHRHTGHRAAARTIAKETARMPSPDEVACHLPNLLNQWSSVLTHDHTGAALRTPTVAFPNHHRRAELPCAPIFVESTAVS
jgi:hypothetical protein